MAYNKIPTVILIFCLFALGIASSAAEPVDSGTYWLMVDTSLDGQTSPLFNSLTKMLIENGKVLKDQITELKGENATYDGIKNALDDIKYNPAKIEKVVFLYHGTVSKPHGSSAMHLSTQSEETIEDATLNKWIKETNADKTVVIIDGYANDMNLGIYYANRETLGTAALNVIHPVASAEPTGKNSFLSVLSDTLSKEEIDTDDNRHISIIEIHQHLQDNNTFENAILAPTGNVDDAVMKLSPGIKVASFPEGATILLNGTENGLTPKLFTKELQQITYNVSVQKPGYKIPQSKSAELKLTQGEIVDFAWVLEPISVFGSLTAPEGVTVNETQISIDGTDYVQSAGEDGNYTFQEWDAANLLIPGKDYTLLAKLGDLYYGSTTFKFDGNEGIDASIALVKKTWFEIAELEFSRNEHQKAVTAFQNGIEGTTDFPQLSTDLTVLLLSTFANAIDTTEIEDVKYIVVTAKLAETYQQLDLAKKYWKRAKENAVKGSSIAKMAGNRLWQMSPWRNIVNIGIVVFLILAIASGVWTFLRFRKVKTIETDG